MGIKNADDYIEKVCDKEDCVLFLDAFDEDTRAIDDHRQRLGELLELCRDFRQVLITSRTQFFPQEEEIPRETGIVKVGITGAGESHEYSFYKLYLSPFSDDQVARYVKRRFPIWRRQQRRQEVALGFRQAGCRCSVGHWCASRLRPSRRSCSATSAARSAIAP